MKEWRENLQDVLAGRPLADFSANDRQILVGTIQEFAEELRRNGKTVMLEVKEDWIDLKVASGSGLEMDLLVKGKIEMGFSLFSTKGVVSNFNIGFLLGLEREQLLQALVIVYAGAIRSR